MTHQTLQERELAAYLAFLRSKPRRSYGSAVVSEVDNTERYRARRLYWEDQQNGERAAEFITIPDHIKRPRWGEWLWSVFNPKKLLL